jgi:hypothetical protein
MNININVAKAVEFGDKNARKAGKARKGVDS